MKLHLAVEVGGNDKAQKSNPQEERRQTCK